MTELALKVGLTPELTCSYLPEQSEQLLVLLDESHKNPAGYEKLLALGFRRSGNDLYCPYCLRCQACNSLRIPVESFSLSRNQKRVKRQNQDLDIRLSTSDQPEYYDLFERYINQRHSDGCMYPASQAQYQNFLICTWLTPYFIEFHLDDELIAVAITDPLPGSLSAMYTFFAPEHADRSIGTLAILTQIELAHRMNRKWLYLGYQVESCRKMQYKTKFNPHQLLIGNEWKSGAGCEQ